MTWVRGKLTSTITQIVTKIVKKKKKKQSKKRSSKISENAKASKKISIVTNEKFNIVKCISALEEAASRQFRRPRHCSIKNFDLLITVRDSDRNPVL